MTTQGDASATPERIDELAFGLQSVRQRIADACAQHGRGVDEVTLIVVTKTYPARDVVALRALGVSDVGENRDQEAGPKHALVSAGHGSSSHGGELTWHCIGQVQTNKVKSIVAWADVIHSIDRPRLVSAFGRAMQGLEHPREALIQVSLDPSGDVERGGCDPGDVLTLADLIAATGGLTIRGVMAVAPLAADPGLAFERLRTISERLREIHPAASWISAGMSGDLEQAIAAGATHVRVGSAVLGTRPPVG